MKKDHTPRSIGALGRVGTAIQGNRVTRGMVSFGKTLGLITGSVGLAVLLFPVLVLGSAAILVVLLWPLFLGQHLDLGWVPGTKLGYNLPSMRPMWYLLMAAWAVTLIVGTVGGLRWQARRVAARRRSRYLERRARIAEKLDLERPDDEDSLFRTENDPA